MDKNFEKTISNIQEFETTIKEVESKRNYIINKQKELLQELEKELKKVPSLNESQITKKREILEKYLGKLAREIQVEYRYYRLIYYKYEEFKKDVKSLYNYTKKNNVVIEGVNILNYVAYFKPWIKSIDKLLKEVLRLSQASVDLINNAYKNPFDIEAFQKRLKQIKKIETPKLLKTSNNLKELKKEHYKLTSIDDRIGLPWQKGLFGCVSIMVIIEIIFFTFEIPEETYNIFTFKREFFTYMGTVTALTIKDAVVEYRKQSAEFHKQ